MARLISLTVQWILRKLGLLIVIVAILVGAAMLNRSGSEHREIQAALGDRGDGTGSLRSSANWMRSTLASRPSRRRRRASRGQYLDLAKQARAARVAAQRARTRVEKFSRKTYWSWDDLCQSRKGRGAQGRAREVRRARSRGTGGRGHPGPQLRGRRDLRKQVEQLESRRAEHLASADAFDRQHEQQAREVERNPREQMIATVKSRIPLALGILAGILLLPALIKTILYFGVAPLAGRLAPVRILPAADAPPFPRPPRSEVSAALEIAPGEELLVQPDFLQSSSQPAIKRTRWFLNPRLPFASLASGMFALTSVRPEGEAPTRAVVSSQRDPFSEIGVIDIPAGAAMVIQPRSLAAVVKPAGEPTHITRHWRLGSLHAWITLQLRYLVFHGPCRLLLKGCRGVRAEAPLPDQPRLINQAATLGFSANLEYRTIRCETFVPYLRGQEELFNDLFAGGPGWFIYEEMPAADRRGGVTGRGLEGISDAFLKAFGI